MSLLHAVSGTQHRTVAFSSHAFLPGAPPVIAHSAHTPRHATATNMYIHMDVSLCERLCARMPLFAALMVSATFAFVLA